MHLLFAVQHAQTLLAAGAPNPAPVAPPGVDGAATTFLGWMKWIGLIAGVGGLMLSGIMMTVGRRNRHQMAVEGAAGVPWALGGLTLISLAAGITGAVLH